MRKHRKYCFTCIYRDTCFDDNGYPDKCPIGNFDEYDK